MKKKGFTLLLAVVSIAIISIITLAIVALAASSNKNTLFREKKYKLKLKAESGIERMYYYLREYIRENPNVFVDNSYTEAGIYSVAGIDTSNYLLKDTTISDGMSCRIVLSISNYIDTPTNRTVKGLQIASTANYSSGGTTQKVTAVIDLDSIYNEYFDRLFNHSSFTTAPNDKGTNIIDSSFTLQDPNYLVTSGNMLLQGINVLFNPNKTMNRLDEGEIRVKTSKVGVPNAFQTNILLNSDIIAGTNVDPVTANLISLYKETDEPTSFTLWKNKPMDYLYMSPIDLTDKNSFQLFGNATDPIIDANINIVDTDADLKLVTFKAKLASGSLDFQKLVDGPYPTVSINGGIYGEIVARLLVTNPIDWLDVFGSYYKMVIIDGNLDIPDDPDEKFNNYIIYCTGKVTFKGRAHFYNSSIFANNIEINNSSGQTGVEFYGVNSTQSTSVSRGHIIGTTVLQDLTPRDKSAIYKYLMENLTNFGQALKFQIISWKES
ncbi:MAG TPA: hypothetical protein VIK72_03035 [Clostridiaceae bacterium]